MKRAVLAAVVLAVVVAAAGARAELVRGTIKIDVRDGKGAPREAPVTVKPEAGGESRVVARTGEVYVADGLLDGNWVVVVEGAAPVTVRVRERRTVGAVVVLDGGKPQRGKRAAPSFNVGPTDKPCDADAGLVVEAIAFAGGVLGAGRLEVKTWSGKPLCSATLAGGGATLRLTPGDYVVDARFVGGKTTRAHYKLRADRPVPPLLLTAK